MSSNILLTYEEIIARFQKIFGNEYDYSLLIDNFHGVNSKISVICKTHGVFEIYFKVHQRGVGCPCCKKEKYLQNLIQKWKQIHNNLYDYSLIVNICKTNAKVKIICPEHGVFEQGIYHHLRGKGCPKCVGKNKTNEEILHILNVIHNNKYCYPNFLEISNLISKTFIKIICPDHGEFVQRLDAHKSGSKCPTCAKLISIEKIKVKPEKAIIDLRKVHGDRYEYDFSNLKDSRSVLQIKCPIHGWFQQVYHTHYQGSNCPYCSNNGLPSANELFLLDFIKANYIKKIETSNRVILNGKELDIYLPDLKLAFEFNGLYWHSELYKDKSYHYNKTLVCEKQGIHLVQIYEDDWKFKQDIVKSRILNLLGLSKKIYARKCTIKEISFKESKKFLENNHLQGSCVDKVRLGLYCENELVSVMTFGKLRKNLGQKATEGSFELLRFCNKIGLTIVGGANKLFKTFINTYKPREVISYADRSWTMNNGKTLYDSIGFKLNRITKPNYFYINNTKRENRFKYRKNILIKQGFDQNKTEHDIMSERKIFRIYDSGQLKYKYL